MFIDVRERGRGAERKPKRNIDMRNIPQLLPTCTLTRDRTHNLLGQRMMLQPTEPPRQGSFCCALCACYSPFQSMNILRARTAFSFL